MRLKMRLPFALALAATSCFMLGLKLWPFTPPDEASRTAASGAAAAPEVLRPWLRDHLYRPLEQPQKGDWLDSMKEWSQSVNSWRNSKPNLPGDPRKVLYLMPLGDFPEKGRAPSLELLREYLGLFFGMEARLMPAVPESMLQFTSRINEETHKSQWLTLCFP